jgi:TP901 family phage tail tape measure protein
MPNDIGKLLIRYGVDVSDVDKAEGQLKKSMSRVGDHALSIGKMIASAAGLGSLIYVGANVAKEFMGFEDAMQKVKVVSGATAEEFENMNKLAREMGTTTEHSSAKVAEAMYELASAGLSAADMASVLPSVLDLATAGGLELGDAAEVTMKALSGFGLAGTEATHVTDVMALAVNKSMLHFEDLSLSMKYVAPIAGATGQSLEDMTAALAIMSDAGVRGEQAGTSLRAGLLRLVDPTREVIDGLKTLGLTQADINPSTHSLSEIMNILAQRTANLTLEQKNQALANIFGTEALSGMLAIVNKGPAALDDLSASFKNSSGTAKSSAEQMRESFGKQLEILKNNLMEVCFTVLEKAMPSIEKFIAKIKEWAESGDLEEFANGMGDLLSDAIDLFTKLSDAVTWVTDKFGGLTNALYVLAAAYATLKLTTWVSGLQSAGAAAAAGAAGSGAAGAAGAGAAGAAGAGGAGLLAAQAAQPIYAFGGAGMAGSMVPAAASLASIAAVGAGAIYITNKYANEAKAAIAEANSAWQNMYDTLGDFKVDNVKEAAAAYSILGGTLDHTSDTYQNYKQKMLDAGMAEGAATQAAALAASGRKEGINAIAAQYQNLVALTKTTSDPVALEEIHRQMALLGELMPEVRKGVVYSTEEIQAAVIGAVQSMGEVPFEVKQALASSNEEFYAAGVDSMATYVEGMMTNIGVPPEQAAQMAQLTRDALSSTDPDVRANAANTIAAMANSMAEKGYISFEAAKLIGDNIRAGLDPGPSPAEKLASTLASMETALIAKLGILGPLAKGIGEAIRKGLEDAQSPDISYKVPATYRKMFSNLDATMSANLPHLQAQLNVVMPKRFDAPQVAAPGLERALAKAASVNHVHFHVPGFFGSQQELDDLARRLTDEHIPRVTFGRGGR